MLLGIGFGVVLRIQPESVDLTEEETEHAKQAATAR